MSEKQIKTDFSDWLVVSDIDGTLNNKLRRLPKKNYDAINEFVVEKRQIYFGFGQKCKLDTQAV